MVSNALPRPTDPKMKELFIHTEETSSNHACTQDGYVKCLHPTIIDGEMTLDSGWFLVDFWVVGYLTCD
jgi:hypothetical protein